jgi:D-alanyl-D-alanine dipeptidase
MTTPTGDPGFGAVPVRDCGESLVDVQATAPLRVAGGPAGGGDPGYRYLRAGVVDRLVVAQSLLPREVLLLVVSGYWPPSGPGDATTVFPSHRTGAAVDLTLCGLTGTPLLLDAAGPQCPTCLTAGPVGVADHGAGEQSEPERHHRRLLVEALTAMGFVGHPARWWHWSYGDQYWAFRKQAPRARYGSVPHSPAS